MQLAAGHDLSVSFGTRLLFEKVHFSVSSTAHIGLVGMNGCGKTTLFRLLTGEMKPDCGQIVLSRETSLAYMEQVLDADENMTLYEAVGKVFMPLIAIEKQLEQVNEKLEFSDDAALIQCQQQLREKFQAGGGYTYEARIRSALLGLGFEQGDLAAPVSTLSGGQRSKAALAKVLLSDANLLLLDEPTNHLDIAAIEWLENYLSNYRGAFIVISHDRYFLDKITDETWAMEHGSLSCFTCNYSAHLEKKAGDEEARWRRYKNQLREIRRIEGIIAQQKRFNQARNYITIASKQKQLDRIKRELVKPENAAKTLNFHFDTPPPGGNDVLALHDVSKSFGSKRLFDHVELNVQKGERVFLLGRNGCGKSTLMKIIAGILPADSGSVRLGANILPAYYDQLQIHLRGKESILEHMTDAYPRLTQSHIRTMLGTFLFPGDDVEKSIDALSGGERARLELLKLIMRPVNFVLLDEPTNHLDIAGREAVEEALADYPGAILAVSHDRYLINRLADRIYIMDEKGLTPIIGNYDDYLESLQKPDTAEYSSEETAKISSAQGMATSVGGEEYRRRKELRAQQQKLAKRKDRLGQELAEKEAELDNISQQIETCPPEDYMRLAELVGQKEELEEAMLLVMEELEELQELQEQ